MPITPTAYGVSDRLKMAVVLTVAANDQGSGVGYREVIRQLAAFEAETRTPQAADKTRVRRALMEMHNSGGLVLHKRQHEAQWRSVSLPDDASVDRAFSDRISVAFNSVGVGRLDGVPVRQMTRACDVTEQTIKNWMTPGAVDPEEKPESHSISPGKAAQSPTDRDPIPGD